MSSRCWQCGGYLSKKRGDIVSAWYKDKRVHVTCRLNAEHGLPRGRPEPPKKPDMRGKSPGSAIGRERGMAKRRGEVPVYKSSPCLLDQLWKEPKNEPHSSDG